MTNEELITVLSIPDFRTLEDKITYIHQKLVGDDWKGKYRLIELIRSVMYQWRVIGSHTMTYREFMMSEMKYSVVFQNQPEYLKELILQPWTKNT